MFLSTLRKGVSLGCIWKIGTQLWFWGHTARSLPAVLFLCCAHLSCLLLKLTLLEVWGQLFTGSAGSLGKMTALMKCTRRETLSSSLRLCTICLLEEKEYIEHWPPYPSLHCQPDYIQRQKPPLKGTIRKDLLCNGEKRCVWEECRRRMQMLYPCKPVRVREHIRVTDSTFASLSLLSDLHPTLFQTDSTQVDKYPADFLHILDED